MALAASAASLGIGRAITDQQQVGVGRAGHLEAFQQNRSILPGASPPPENVRPLQVGVQEPVLLHHRAQDRVGLDQFDLRGQELIGVVGTVRVAS